ncbi:MAG: ATP-binding cassette domain-containing protein [Rubrivivax sp.]|nr:ATP-binding cassette domain-containing protein [Rubrivivax sp.]
MRSAGNFLRSALDMARGRQIVSGDDVEEFWALRDLNFEIRRGDVVGVIGRNGAGKSTLLKVLSRITEPSEGRAQINGRVSSLLEVGTGFHPELSGRENIYLNGAILGMSRDEIRRKFDEIVAFSEVERFLDTPVKRYSSGMYVRLAFAVAAHLESEILVIDEVLAVGDTEFQKRCLGKMHSVARSGRTVLFVSHSLSSVATLCNRGILLSGGVVELASEIGPVLDYYRRSWINHSHVLTWQPEVAPGDDTARLLSIRASQSKQRGHFVTSEPLLIIMEVKVLKLEAGLNIGFEMQTSDGTSLLWSHFTDSDEQEWPQLHLGVNKLCCEIPRELLNAGTYYIAPKISIHSRRWIADLQPTLPLELHLDHGLSPYWTSQSDGKRLGLLTPILNWSNTLVANN